MLPLDDVVIEGGRGESEAVRVGDSPARELGPANLSYVPVLVFLFGDGCYVSGFVQHASSALACVSGSFLFARMQAESHAQK